MRATVAAMLLGGCATPASTAPAETPREPAWARVSQAIEVAPPDETAPAAEGCFAMERVGVPSAVADAEARCRGTDDVGECLFEVGRRRYAARELESAGTVLLAIARDPPEAVLGARAAELALEAMNEIGSKGETPRPVCYDLMAAVVPDLVIRLCTPDAPRGGERACAMLHLVDADLAIFGAPRTPRPAAEARAAAAALYMRLVVEECPLGAGSLRAGVRERCGELLHDASVLFARANDVVRAEEAKRLLLDPKNGLSRTKWAERARWKPAPMPRVSSSPEAR